MSTLNGQLFLDACIVYGIGRKLTATIQQPTQETQNMDSPTFEALDLTPYAVRFRVLGSADGDGTILLEKIITLESDVETDGIINDPENGEFTFVVNGVDTKVLGVGVHPISIELVDSDTLENIYTLTEGGINQGEFSKIQIVYP